MDHIGGSIVLLFVIYTLIVLSIDMPPQRNKK